jgi:ATP-dependent RNA helicase RhlE
MPFEGLGLHKDLIKAVHEAGYTRPTPIQTAAIPPAMEGRDLIGAAQTGTGKTAAFLLPMLHRFMQSPGTGKTRGLILTPTRELAVQIEVQSRSLAKHTSIRSLAVYGGMGMEQQTRTLRRGVDIVIATPGRLLDHLNRGNAVLGHTEIFVLDEADRMLDMGFLPDIRKIIASLAKKRQTLFFSATMPGEIVTLAREILHDPLKINVGGDIKTAAGIRHAAYPVPQHLKSEMLLTLLRDTKMLSVLVFTRTRMGADRVMRVLDRAGFKTGALHSDRTQMQRLKSLEGFRKGDIQILVATDIAARGIDVANISHVINYDIPNTPEAYIHRVGRTARAETVGDAFTLVSSDEERALRMIEKSLGPAIPRVKLPDFNYRAAAPVRAPGAHREPAETPRPRRGGFRDERGNTATRTSDDPRRTGAPKGPARGVRTFDWKKK